MADEGLRRVRVLLREARSELATGVRADLDQCPSTTATVLARLALLEKRERDILFVGDDDLCSLAAAVTNARARIAVLDADDALLCVIGKHAPPRRVELVRHDVRRVLPNRLRGRFDDAFTDPPYTLAGQLVFVRAAALSLRRAAGASLYVCASRAYLDADSLREVRTFLARAGFDLHAVHPQFNRYRAPADVRRDLARAGCSTTRWLASDLFHYVRSSIRPIPRLPTGISSRIYAY